jgi:hypothetical protein
MRTIVVTKKTENLINDLTISRIESYAKKINSDFRLLELGVEELHVFWEIPNILSVYDRLIYISPYVLLRPDTPNLFDLVPSDELGMFDEGRYADRNIHMKSAITYYKKDIKKDWLGKYYSSDVIVISRKHRGLFKKPEYEVGYEFNPYINLRIHNDDVKIFCLPYKYNRMEYLDNQIGISRLDSYMINYSDAPQNIIREIVEKDVKKWDEDSPEYIYKQNILIKLSAGMGDQIDSEPVARYVRKLYPEANIYLTTHHPRAFRHLTKYGIEVHDYTTWKGINDAILIMENNPSEAKSKSVLTHVMFHPTDFSSISMIRRTIPLDERDIKLDVDIKDVSNLIEMTKHTNKEKKKVVVHAGKWWESKTFPKDWWQNVVDLLSEKLCVVLVGSSISEKQGYVDINCPNDGIDLRDGTTLGELIALISVCKVTLSNDSSPIHIAGAFDNWIVLIPTCKSADHTFPYRNGSTRYKTKSLCKRLIFDDYELRHTEFSFDTIDKIPKGKTIYDYLPEPQEVAEEIFDIYFNKE